MAAAVEVLNQRPHVSTSCPLAGKEINVFKRFQKMRPPIFSGATDPIVAEHWLKHILKLMGPLGCLDAQKVTLATFALEGEADEWWDLTCRPTPTGYLWMWKGFQTKFNEKYFLESFCDEKVLQFFKLK
ncbi:uncharacterized protein LOC131228813 [Magnolia sinica]|uniref:uncharacterized protein LOC131228813 n=1 Tax=Magnolia sinica TaxID=86752 RepID=UPI002658DECA|nr:uncharacterized protein LOC131228813 [Magnolia sinica]